MFSVYSPASAREITVGGNGSGTDFTLIQEAVNNSSSGDLILVYPGFYNESVDIIKENISILSESENPEDTAVRDFNVSANNITLRGFKVLEYLNLQGPENGIWHDKIENCTVKSNIMESGIGAEECYNSTIEKNVILNSGIYISGPEEDSSFTVSDNLIVSGGIGVSHGPYNCVLLNNTLLKGGISSASSSGDCKILGNYISNGIDDGYGIVLFEASSEIKNNTIVNCSEGICLTRLTGNNIVYNNTLIHNDKGISVWNSGGNLFSNNTISKNNIGILVDGSTMDQAGENSILNNTISNNNIGISLKGDSYENLVANNRVELNAQFGLYINQFKDNIGEMPYHGTNHFYNNMFNNTVNFFNDTGNYTGDYCIAKAINISAGKNSVSLNTAKTSGINIAGGSYLGGNFWAKPDGTGFSQNCNDWNTDGIGDLIHTASAYDIDYLPLVSMPGDRQPVFPVADFSTNVSNGYVPLSILFTDLSRNAISTVWDFENDGIIDSTDKTPVHVYPVSGTYTVNLTVNNANGTSSKLYPVTASDRPQYTLTEAQITTNKSNQTKPVIYGDKIVFFDDRSGWGHYNIYIYDLSTSRETQIPANISYYDYETWPAIYGDRIVWKEYRNNNGRVESSGIHVYNLSTSKETPIINSINVYDPDIYGDRIVWTDTRNENGDIYMYNLSTGRETRITTNESNQDDPVIYDDKIVWHDWRNGNKTSSKNDIYMYNLSTSTETQITTSGFASNPKIHGDRLVYLNGSHIYMYNLSTAKETRITTCESIKSSPSIYGDRIVWTDDRNRNGWGNPDIYMYDLSTHAETPITSNKSGQSDPVIYSDRVVWVDSRNGYTVNGLFQTNEDIYMCTVSVIDPSLKTPVADFSANVTSGNAPLIVLFTDSSTGAPNFWHWDFGDGINSKHALNATHTFTEPGNYDVSLTVTNENGSNTRIMSGYVTVYEGK
ncbi:PKD domain-containing protein [Methanosarcina sp. MSH10X1]|nr:PKD domain-containing protein [Methanosarcina sp. MSH10X1]